MSGMLRAVAEVLLPRAEEKAQKFVLEIDASTGSVIGDARRLRESVEHILRNAVAYTEEDGQITLTASGTHEEVTVIVADNGPGIEPGDQAQVFARFHRSGSTGRGDAALGLGLPLTRQFIEAHGGKVELQSEPGKGTSVTMTIPRAPQ